MLGYPLEEIYTYLMEKVQQKATKILHDIKEQSYRMRLVATNSPKLKRMRGDMITIFKFLSETENVRGEQVFQIIKVKSVRGHSNKISRRHVRDDVKKYFYRK